MFGLFKSKEQKALEFMERISQQHTPQTENAEPTAFLVGLSANGNIQLKVGGATLTMDAQTTAFLIRQLSTLIQDKFQVEIKQIIEVTND